MKMNAMNEVKVFGVVLMLVLAMSACVGSGSSDALTIYGTTGSTVSASDAATSAVKAGQWGSQGVGAPTSVKIRLYAVYLGASNDCSDVDLVTPVQDYGADGQEFDLAVETPEIASGNPAAGEYNCMIMKMSSVISFTPDEIAAGAYSSCTQQEHQFPLARAGDGEYLDLVGNAITYESTLLNPVAQTLYIFASTDTTQIPDTRAGVYQRLAMAEALTVPGSSYFIMNFDDRIEEMNNAETGDQPLCTLESPQMGFSDTSSVDSIKSWFDAGSAVLTTEGTSVIDLDASSESLFAMFRTDGGDIGVKSTEVRGGAEWTDMAFVTSGSAGIAAAMSVYDDKPLVGYHRQSPIPSLIFSRGDGGNSWDDFSTNIEGITAPSVLRIVNDGTYFYAASVDNTANRAVTVYRISVDATEADGWTRLGAGTVADTTQSLFGIGAYNEYVYLAETSDGIKVQQYDPAAGTWSQLGAAISTETPESISLAIVAETPYVAYTMPTSNAIAIVCYDAVAGTWGAVGATDIATVQATSAKIDGSGATPFLGYIDTGNSNVMRALRYQTDAWLGLESSTIASNATVINDFIAYSGIPYVAYESSSDGQTASYVKKFTTSQ